MGRLLAHELYHMLANKRGHAESGVGKASFSASDVLGERFTLSVRRWPELTAGLRRARYTDAAGIEEADASGR